jgi:hypothetical protein
MIRLFYTASAVLLLSVLTDYALAESSNVSLSPGFADSASSPRFSSQAQSNIDRKPTASLSDQQLKSERCTSLSASINYNKANSLSLSQQDRGGNDYANNPWGGPDSHSSPDRQRELERQSSMLGCSSH